MNTIPLNHRNEHVISVLSSGSLRRSLTDVDAELTISTIHGAKGLEWDYVFIANFEQLEFPSYPEMLKLGVKSQDTSLNVTNSNVGVIQEIVNKLYVAFSRAKCQVYFSYCEQRYTKTGSLQKTSLSVLALLPFFKKTIIG